MVDNQHHAYISYKKIPLLHMLFNSFYSTIHMEKTNELSEQGDTSTVYVIGAIIVVAVIIAGILLWPKPKPQTAQTGTAGIQTAVVAKPNITTLACEGFWYNSKIGFPEFYLSAEGVDVDPSKNVECTFTVTDANKTVATEKITANVTPAPERNGNAFRCISKAIELPKNTPLTLTITMKDDKNATASCIPGTMTFQ